MNWTDHHCGFDHHDGRLRNEDEVLDGIRERLAVRRGADAAHGDGAADGGEQAEPGEDGGSDAYGTDWQKTLYGPFVVAAALVTAVITWFASNTGDRVDESSQLPVALIAGLVAGLVGAATARVRSLALVLSAELSAVAGLAFWQVLGDVDLEVWDLAVKDPAPQVVGVVLIVIVANLALIAGLLVIEGRAEYAVRRLITSAAIAVAWWGALNIENADFFIEDKVVRDGLGAGLYGAVGVLAASLAISLLEDVRLWLNSGSTEATATDLLNELDRTVAGLSVLRTVDEPSDASELRMSMLGPTERAARLVERQLGRSLSRQAARTDSRRVLPYVTTRSWLRADLALRGEAIRQLRRDLVLPEQNNADRLRAEVIHVMAHVERWEWLGIPAVRGADPARHRRRRRIRIALVSAVLFAPLVFMMVGLSASWSFVDGIDQQLLPFAVPLAFAGIAVVSGAVSLRDLSGNVVAGGVGSG